MNKAVFQLLFKILTDPIDISSLKLYAAMQMLRHTMDTSTWKYPYAAFMGDKRLTKKIDNDKLGNYLRTDFISSTSYKEDFSKIYHEFSVLSFADFLIEYAPELVTNISETLNALEEIDQHMTTETQCKYILDMRRVQVLRSSFSALERWEIYQKLVKENANSAPPLSREDLFEMLYTSVNCYSLSFRRKVHVADKNAVDIMKRFHLPTEYLIQFYAQVRGLIAKSFTGRKQKAIKEITSPAHYIRKRIGLDPKLDPLELDELLNDAAAQIVKIKQPTDFLRALKDPDDSPLEIGFVRQKFLKRITANDTILIINPAPDFILSWPEDLLERTAFCVEYEIESQILRCEFPTVNFHYFDDLLAAVSEPSTSEGPYSSYTQILFFGRNLSPKIQQQILIASSVLSPNEKISVLTSSVFLDQSTPFQWGATYFMRGWSISLLPNGVANSEPKRKIYIEEISDEQHKTSIVLQNFDWAAESSEVLEMTPQPEIKMQQDELISGAKTLRMLYREKLDTKEKTKRKSPQEYRFTRDISFWYTISHPDPLTNPKVEVYVCKLPTSAQEKRTKQARGAKIKSAYTSTTKFDLEHISVWLEETVPYNVRIHDGVVQAFAKCPGNWIFLTLKSYWYLVLDVSKISDNPWFEMERELFSSPVGSLTLLAEEDDIQEEMQAFLETKTDAEARNYWTILSNLFDQAVREQYMPFNPAREYVEQFCRRHTESQKVRDALTKKSFRLEEEQTLLHLLDEKLPSDGGYLGIAIRYFTGLESNTVCALTWGDVHKLDDGNHQFWIQRQVSNDGKTVSGFTQVEDYRRLPIPDMLYVRLNERRKYMKEQLSLTSINELPIIAPDDILLKGNAFERLSPRALARLARKVISEMGIPENVIYLPDKANGVKETNLSSYHGDIFRSHIRYRLNVTCGFTDAEMRYFLGLTQVSTFGKHYCDFRNECAQMLMAQKLRRWEVKLSEKQSDAPIPVKRSVNGKKSIKIDSISTGPTVLDINLKLDTDGELSIDSPGGIRGDIQWK